MIREKSCGVVLVRLTSEPHYLLLHYPSGHWDLPKGHQEPGETDQQTAKRELQEETGITQCQILEGFKKDLSYAYSYKEEKRHKTVQFFCAITDQAEVSLSHEHQGFAWLPYEQAKEQLTFENAKQLLDQAHEFFAKAL